MSGIFDGLGSIWEGISSLPAAIGSYITSGFNTVFGWLGDILSSIGNGFTTLWTWLKNVLDSIIELPGKIFDLIFEGLKSIFVPDPEHLKAEFNDMVSHVESSFGLVEEGFDDLADSWTEKPLDNIEESYSIHGIGSLKLKFFDTQYLKQGIEKFRPVIRGFLVLMVFFYNYYQILSFINQDPGIHASAEKTAMEHISKKEGGKI